MLYPESDNYIVIAFMQTSYPKPVEFRTCGGPEEAQREMDRFIRLGAIRATLTTPDGAIKWKIGQRMPSLQTAKNKVQTLANPSILRRED